MPTQDDRIHLGPNQLDRRTYTKLTAAEKRLGRPLTVVQGSYSNGVSQSAGTHDGGGALDLSTRGLDRADIWAALTALRQSGLIAWHRPAIRGLWADHIHALDYGNPRLSPAAARQVKAYEAGRDGLATNGPDTGPSVHIPKTPPTSRRKPAAQAAHNITHGQPAARIRRPRVRQITTAAIAAISRAHKHSPAAQQAAHNITAGRPIARTLDPRTRKIMRQMADWARSNGHKVGPL